jgi:tRNA(Leu) C34 or U34 (ribose-2'-O)-methylase TrmL
MSYDVDQHGLDTRAFVEAKDPKGQKVRVKPTFPAVVLTDPKFPHNLGQCVRALSCFGVPQLWWSGHRVLKELEGLSRIPREERMRGYADVQILWNERPLDAYGKDVTPVCIELVPGSENLVTFEHPENAVYVFGPEDGSVDQGTRRMCHRFVHIPTKHCTNLSAAVYLVLYDRLLKSMKEKP